MIHTMTMFDLVTGASILSALAAFVTLYDFISAQLIKRLSCIYNMTDTVHAVGTDWLGGWYLQLHSLNPPVDKRNKAASHRSLNLVTR